MKSSLVGEQKKKTKKTRAQTRTRTHTHAEPEEIKKKGDRQKQSTKKKNTIQINVLLQQLPILFPCTFSELSVGVIASVQYLIPSSSYPLFLFICFPPLPLFHNHDEKTGRGRGSWVL